MIVPSQSPQIDFPTCWVFFVLLIITLFSSLGTKNWKISGSKSDTRKKTKTCVLPTQQTTIVHFVSLLSASSFSRVIWRHTVISAIFEFLIVSVLSRGLTHAARPRVYDSFVSETRRKMTSVELTSNKPFCLIMMIHDVASGSQFC